jgi:hypothetical protein
VKIMLAAVAAVLSLNAMAASIPPETHTINGLSIFNESGILWSRGEAEYDAETKAVFLVQYAKAPNGSWTRNTWVAGCDMNKAVLARQVRGVWSNNARTYDMFSERQFVADSDGVKTFKAALCPAGKKAESEPAKVKAQEPVSTEKLTATIPGIPGREPEKKSSQRVLTGQLTGGVGKSGLPYFSLYPKEGKSLDFPNVANQEVASTLVQMLKRKRDVTVTAYVWESDVGYLYVDESKPVTVISN